MFHLRILESLVLISNAFKSCFYKLANLVSWNEMCMIAPDIVLDIFLKSFVGLFKLYTSFVFFSHAAVRLQVNLNCVQ